MMSRSGWLGGKLNLEMQKVGDNVSSSVTLALDLLNHSIDSGCQR